MNPTIWKAIYSVGNKELDTDHQMLFKLLHDCYVDFSAKSNEKVNPDILLKLKHYATKHFSYEEAIMRKSRVPDFDRHEKQHRFFEEKVAELGRFRKRDGSLQFESTVFFLNSWIRKHIMEEDKKYEPYI